MWLGRKMMVRMGWITMVKVNGWTWGEHSGEKYKQQGRQETRTEGETISLSSQMIWNFFFFFSFDTNFCSTWIQYSLTTPSKNEQKIPLSITLSPFSSVLESNLTQPTIQNCFHYQCYSTSTDSGLYCTCFTSYHWAILVYCVHSIICDYVSPFSRLSCVISTSSFQFIAVPFLSILSSIHNCKMQM